MRKQKNKPRKKLKKWQKILIGVIIAAIICIVVFGVYKWIVRTQMDEETKKRDSWTVETGELIGTNQDQRVNIYESATDSQISVYQIVPREVERDSFTFHVTEPKTVSGYGIKLESTEGTSGGALERGLYYTLGTQGYYGYMFFFDNDGVMRYEMLLDGYKADRVLMDGGEMICCVSSNQIGRINALGQVTELYTMDGYVMHHDFNWGNDGTLLVLATKENDRDDAVMDRVLEIDMDAGTVEEIINLQDIFPEYYDQTDKVAETDPFFWQAGTRDWIHVNTIDTLGEDSIILSSRETSTIIKISDIYSEPKLSWLIGDSTYWEETGYEDFTLEKAGDFTDQYGQHTVTVIESEELPQGQYYLMMYNNNYYANSTRTDGYEPELDEQVSQDLSDDEESSYIYFYLVDENEGTYSLEWSFDVPYSSIVSSVQLLEENYVVNSGVAKTYGEYDSQGEMIRSFSYDTTFQGYRVMKDDFLQYWFK